LPFQLSAVTPLAERAVTIAQQHNQRVYAYGSTIFKVVQQKWPPTSYRPLRTSLKSPESAVA
jgi:hypothetical protein